MVAKTDDVAFGNEVARMISLSSIIESNSYLRSPKSKQTESWFALGLTDPSALRAPPLLREGVMSDVGGVMKL